MPTKDQFTVEITRILSEAKASGAESVDINSGAVHRAIGGYPARNHAIRTCCLALRDTMRTGDRIVSAPPRGAGASLTIRYFL